jgi:hypothetical protein
LRTSASRKTRRSGVGVGDGAAEGLALSRRFVVLDDGRAERPGAGSGVVEGVVVDDDHLVEDAGIREIHAHRDDVLDRRGFIARRDARCDATSLLVPGDGGSRRDHSGEAMHGGHR